MTHTVHGIPFHRVGKCDRCIGGQSCCPRDCPHLTFKDGGDWCAIYDERQLPCECDTGLPHQVCIDFPDHPWLVVIMSGKCAYRFVRLDERGEPSSEPLPFMDLEKHGN